MSYSLTNITRAEAEKLRLQGYPITPMRSSAKKPNARTKSAVKKRIAAAQGARGIYRNPGQATFRLPGADSIQTMYSRTVFEVAFDSGSVRLRLAKGMLASDGSYLGFLNWDGHIAAMINAYKYFRVVRMQIEADIATAPQSGVNLTVGYQAGSTYAASAGAILDNDHAIFITAAKGSGRVIVPRSGLLNGNEWYTAANQSVVTQQAASVDYKSIVPNADVANQGFIQLMYGVGEVTEGIIAYVVVNSTIEFKGAI